MNNVESRGDSKNIKKQNEDDNCIIRLVMRIQNEGEFTAPVQEKMESGQARVLDIGCVRGDWVLSNAAKYRWSHFCGIDSLSLSHCYSFPYLSNESTLPPLPSSPPTTPSLPLYRTSLTTSLPSPSILTSPPNTSFIPCHTLFPLPLQNDYFDFVHMSGMGLSIPTNKLDYVVTELIRVTKPGGWIEIAENDLELANLGTYGERMLEEALNHLTLSLGLSTSPRNHLVPTLLSYPQLECVQLSTQKIKLGSVSDVEGIRWLDDLCGILMRFSDEIGERLGIGGTGEEGMRKLIEKFRKEVVQSKTVGQRVVLIARKKNPVKEVAE
ncbi:5366_t:CDS:2 [Paraglomus occultum]|uniref:5366_t:CDS:1 n=1 Tax=Paraglomus occultum TaxID=144539 RepID=A0A9N9BNA3_9GLOM|nr:5366_t:CDS:2 [Paraglomus occultum]